MVSVRIRTETGPLSKEDNVDRPPPASPGVGSAAFGVAAVFMTLTAWTVAPILIEYFSTDIDLHTSNGWRYGMAALVWSPMVVWLAIKGRVTARMW